MLDFFNEHQDVLNFLLAVVSTFAGLMAWAVRSLYSRLQEQLKFSPATALGIGYFQNFLFKVGQEMARKPRFTIDDKEHALSLNLRKIFIYIPETLPGASHQGVELFKARIEEGGRRVVKAEIYTESRPFPFWAIIDDRNPNLPPVLFDYPTALGNMVEVLNYHLGEEVFSSKRKKRERMEQREIENFSNVISQLIHDKHLSDFLVVTHSEPGAPEPAT